MIIAKEEVNKIQVQDLNAVKNYIGKEIITDKQKPCYILIDDLDRFWVEDPLVYELIRALILEIYDWSNVENVKIVYVLRDNLLSKIECEFKSRAYQREKLEDQRIRIRWSRSELTEIVDRRLEVIASEMGVQHPTLNDILPRKGSRRPSGKDYIFDRILDRPRDIIDYINKAAEISTWKKAVSWRSIQNAEESYSQGRIQALIDEWRENCPGIDILISLLRGGPPRFNLSWWSEDDFMRVFTDPNLPRSGWIAKACKDFLKEYSENKIAAVAHCRREVLKILYEIGIVGIKVAEGGIIRYAHMGGPTISDSEIDMDPEVVIHTAFHSALDINRI